MRDVAPERLVEVPVDVRLIGGGLDLQARALALELFKNQLERCHFLRDETDPLSIDRVARLHFRASQNLKVTIHIRRLEKPARGRDLPRFRTHPDGLGKLIELLHLSLGRPEKEIVVFFHQSLDVEVPVPAELAVNIEHEVGDPRARQIRFVGFRISNRNRPPNFREEPVGVIVEPLKVLLHQLRKNHRNRRKIVIRRVLEVILPDQHLVLVAHLGEPFLPVLKIAIRQHPERTRLAQGHGDIGRHLIQIRRGPVGDAIGEKSKPL